MKDEQFSRLQRLVRLYVPEPFLSSYMNDPALLMKRQNLHLAVMITDIRSFSRLSGDMSPEEVVRRLNDYFRTVADIVYGRNGTIDKYIGDAVLSFFGYPAESEETALHAVLAALEIIQLTEKSEFLATFHTAVGISHGPVSIGNVGHPDRKLNYTIIGDTVNFASRLEGLTSTYKQEILLSESVYDQIKNDLPCRIVDIVSSKGERTTRIYTTKRNLNKEERQAWDKHNEGMDLFSVGDFRTALKCFRAVQELCETDELATMMIERCQNR